MAICDLEAKALGLTAQEREVIDKQLKEALERNRTLAEAIEKTKLNREKLETLRASKREFAGETKANIDTYNKLLKKALEPTQSLEDMKKAFNDTEVLLNNIKRHKETKEAVNEEFKKDILTLKDIIKNSRIKEKETRQVIRESRNNTIKNFIGENFEAARRGHFWSQVKGGKINLMDILDQARVGANSLWGSSARYISGIGHGLKPLYDAVNETDANDLNNPNIKALIEGIKTNVNTMARGLGVEEKYGFKDPSQHPVAISVNKLHKLFFSRVKLTPSNAGREEFKNDLISAYGEEELNKMIEEGYKDAEIVPTLDTALTHFVNAHATGKKSRLSFHNMKFLSDDTAMQFIPKYSDNTIVANYIESARRIAKDLAASKVTGGYMPGELFKLDPNLTDKQRRRLLVFRDHFFGDSYLTSARQHQINNIIQSAKTYLTLTRWLTLALSPIGDRSFGAAYLAMRYGEQGNMINSTISIVKQFAAGLKNPAAFGLDVIGKGESKRALDETSELFRVFQSHVDYRYDTSMRPSFNKWSPKNWLINHFENIDNGLRVVQAKRFATLIRNEGDADFKNVSSRLHKDFSENYKITDDEWKTLSAYVKNNDLLVSADFEGDLAHKVAGMEYNNDLSAIPNKAIIASRFAYDFARTNPAMASFVTMFWQFTAKLVYFNYRAAMQYGGKTAVSTYILQRAAGGMIPELLLTALIGEASGINVEDEFKKPGIYYNAFMGPFSRLGGASWAMLASPSEVGYQTASPLLSETWKAAALGATAFKAAFDPSEVAKRNESFLKFLFSLTPFRNTPIKGIMNTAIKQNAAPYPGTKYQKWIKRAGHHAKEDYYNAFD